MGRRDFRRGFQFHGAASGFPAEHFDLRRRIGVSGGAPEPRMRHRQLKMRRRKSRRDVFDSGGASSFPARRPKLGCGIFSSSDREPEMSHPSLDRLEHPWACQPLHGRGVRKGIDVIVWNATRVA
jgi:hypothetical protein